MQNQFIFETSPFALSNDESETENSPQYIRRLQQTLNRALGLQLPLDGVMGFRTRKAIRNFQRQTGLSADGIVGRETEAEFGDETGTLNFDHEFEYETKTNCKKDWCDPNYVRWVQQSLNRILGLQLKEDGNLEKKTRSAIRSFQTKHRLKADSSLGPATEKALITAGATNPPEIKQLPCGPTNTDELVKLLNKYRGDIPLNFLLSWIKVESGGRIDSLTNLCERGYFQVHPEEAKDYGIKNHQDISYNSDYSVQAGIQIVKRCVARANALADKYGLPKQGELFWGLVKLHHWIPSGPEKILGDMKAHGVKPAGWNKLKEYVASEENRKRLVKILKGFDPMKGINNADKTLNNAKTSQFTMREFNDSEADYFELEGEVNRQSVEYAKWIQQSLNRIMGLQLAVDGDIRIQTRNAIHSFQQKQGLTVDGDVGPMTESALIRAGASSPPQSSGTSPTSFIPTPTIPNGGLTPIEDRTAITARNPSYRKLRAGNREKVWALVLHHTAGALKEKSEELDHVKAHFIITPKGRILQLHPIESLLWASNDLSPRSIAVEFVGNFRNENGICWYPRLIPLPCSQTPTQYQIDHGYFNKNGKCGYYGGMTKPCSNTPTVAQIKAGRDLIQYLIKKIGLTTVLAHRQSGINRVGDPGPDIWYHVGQWAVENLGLSDGGKGFAIVGRGESSGNPIPDVWRTWGKTHPLQP